MERKRALSDRDWDRYRCACCSDFSNNASKLQCHPSDIYSISGSVSTSFRESHHHPVTSPVPVVSHYQMDTTPPLTHGKFVSRWWCGTNELLLVVWEIWLMSDIVGEARQLIPHDVGWGSRYLELRLKFHFLPDLGLSSGWSSLVGLAVYRNRS